MCRCFGEAFVIVQSLSCVWLFAAPWTAARQAPPSSTVSQSLLKFIFIELNECDVSNHLILCHPLLLPSVFPSISIFSNESTLHIRWPKYWSFSFSISASNEYSGLISFRTDWFKLGTLIVHYPRGDRDQPHWRIAVTENVGHNTGCNFSRLWDR